MTERVLDVYTQTLQQGILGLAFLLVVVILLLTIALGLFIRYVTRKDTQGHKTDSQAQTNIHDLIEIQRGQQMISRQMAETLQAIQKAQETNNELKVEQTQAFKDQKNELIAINKSMGEWPKAFTGSLLALTRSFSDVKRWIEKAIEQQDVTLDKLVKLIAAVDTKLDTWIAEQSSPKPTPDPEPIGEAEDSATAIEITIETATS